MSFVEDYLPKRINEGWLLTGYTLPNLEDQIRNVTPVLPICSLGTPAEQLAELGPMVLPPLYHEALGGGLKERILQRILECFPYSFDTGEDVGFALVELPREQNRCTLDQPILAFSVDTAVEEHGPHLPLMTDTIQSYGILGKLAESNQDLGIAPPAEYGHLTWGLPFGLSIDLSPELTTEYVANYLDALAVWSKAKAFYVVDVHGSIVHRTAIQDGMKKSDVRPMAFRWLHEPLIEYAGERGDQHAGGVETALVEYFNPQLLDAQWWPSRRSGIVAGQMDMNEAIGLSSDLPAFRQRVVKGKLNGIVGDVGNYDRLDASKMVGEILEVAHGDLAELQKQL
ncbi:MAG: creatininase family protein [Limisphaerales bacterium]